MPKTAARLILVKHSLPEIVDGMRARDLRLGEEGRRRCDPLAASLPDLCDQLVAETETLDALVRPLGAGQWLTPTPAEGWTVRDQIVHLTRTDEFTRMSIVAPDDFARVRQLRLHRVMQLRNVPGAVEHREDMRKY